MYKETYEQKQARLKAEFDKEGQNEWIECYEGQRYAIVRNRYGRDYGVARILCSTCGKPFYADVGNYRRGRKYCSYRCINDAYIAQRDARRKAARKKVCPVCGKQFDAKRRDAVFCSPACKQLNYRRKKEVTQHEPNLQAVPATGRTAGNCP